MEQNNIQVPKAVRSSLKAIWREFNRCADRYPPLYHELWETSGFRPASFGVSDSFRKAFARRFHDEWEQWHGPVDWFFGRFYGNGEGLQEFKQLAQSAYMVLCTVRSEHPEFSVFRDDWGWHGWMRLLHYMAYGYPTPLLRGTFDRWGNWDTVSKEEELEAFATPDDGGAPYPLHPFHWRLEHSVFVSSASAIELIVDDDRGVLVGEWTFGLPMSYSGHIGNKDVFEDYRSELGNVISFSEEARLPVTGTTFTPTSPSPKPRWDQDRRELSFEGKLVKRYRQRAGNQEVVLAAFEEESWPDKIDDPLPQTSNVEPKRRLRDTVSALNAHHVTAELITFKADGTGEGILWERMGS